MRARFATPAGAAVLLGFAVPGLIGSANGGYFPTAWGWSALALLWLAATALLVLPRVAVARLELGFLATLTTLTAWTLASAAWSPAAQQPVLEAERTAVYVVGCLAALLVVRRETVSHFLGGLLAGIAVVSSYGLATRLLPDRLGRFDPVAGYRLAAPLGYWNALGIFAVLGLLLALGLTARARRVPLRMLAAASVPPLACTLYFTYSRGSWIALGAGALAALAYDRRRLQLLAVGLVLSLPTSAALILSARSPALTHVSASLGDATRQGHRLAGWILALAAVSAIAALAEVTIERRVSAPPALRRAAAAALVIVVVAGLAVAVVRFGSPVAIARRGYHAFVAPTPTTGANLNRRLFTFSGSGRIDLWRGAWRGYADHPLLGLSAGGYERWWLAHRAIPSKVRDAHNLYLEQLAELGPVGLGLLAVAFALPLAALRRARGHPLAPFALAAYVAFLLHAVADWDWEVPAITLTALLCGVALLRAGGDEPRALNRRLPLLVGIVAAAIAVLVGLGSNLALARGDSAARHGEWKRAAADARAAERLAPWAAQPWQRLGEAQLAEGNLANARASFGRAISKDRKDWSLWFDLARASSGREQEDALMQASKLNPLSPEIAEFRRELATQ